MQSFCWTRLVNVLADPTEQQSSLSLNHEQVELLLATRCRLINAHKNCVVAWACPIMNLMNQFKDYFKT